MQRTEVDLPLQLDRAGDRALPVQIADGIRDLVDRGVLRPGERLPASRPLAERWGVARGTVVTGLDQLVAEGYLSPLPGSGTMINPALRRTHPTARQRPARQRRPRTPAPASDVIDLTPGRPDAAKVVDPTWRAAWRTAAAEARATAPPPAGVAALRRELAAHLRQMRGVVPDPDHLVVTAGARDGLHLVLQVWAERRSGRLTVAVEDPGYPSLRLVPRRLGARVVDVPVDDEGIEVAALRRRRPPDVVIVTPSHLYPTGTSMSATRRGELLDWARDNGALVVEDDYDSELRYVGAPLPALAALDQQRDVADRCVVTLGSFSKTVAGDLGAGFVHAPPGLVADLVATRADLGGLPSGVMQRALAHYLAAGGLRRHIERMRRDYRRRRAHLTDALADLDRAEAVCLDGGLHAVVRLESRRGQPAAERERTLVAAAAGKGIVVTPLSRYWAHGRTRLRHGVVVGYPAVGSADEEALTVLRELINRR
ncbi:PLP-dependent aminotransferase family protein [Propionibacteriaceae bacterium Y2011]